jgi:hypothetical protein
VILGGTVQVGIGGASATLGSGTIANNGNLIFAHATTGPWRRSSAERVR